MPFLMVIADVTVLIGMIEYVQKTACVLCFYLCTAKWIMGLFTQDDMFCRNDQK